MSFDSDIDSFIAHMEEEKERIETAAAAEVFRSVVFGSEITGAPGQPVHSGELRDSWTMVKGENETVISSDHHAAVPVEENWSNVTFHNHGPHSVALTEAGWQRIVDALAQ